MADRVIELSLGGETITVPQARIRAETQWREKVRPLVEPLAEMVIAAGISNPTPEKLVKLAFTSALFTDPAAVLDALCAYHADLAERREWIEEHAYSDEVLQAVLTLFFGQMMSGRASTSQPTGGRARTT